MDRFTIIKGALGKLGIPFDEVDYASDEAYKAANWEFDHIMVDAFQSIGFKLNSGMVRLVRAVDDPIVYADKQWWPYQIPDDLLYIIDTEPRQEYKFLRDKVYATTENDLSIIYSSQIQVQELTSRARKYLEYYLAAEISDTLHRSAKKQEMIQRAQYEKGQILRAEFLQPIDVGSDVDWGFTNAGF